MALGLKKQLYTMWENFEKVYKIIDDMIVVKLKYKICLLKLVVDSKGKNYLSRPTFDETCYMRDNS